MGVLAREPVSGGGGGGGGGGLVVIPLSSQLASADHYVALLFNSVICPSWKVFLLTILCREGSGKAGVGGGGVVMFWGNTLSTLFLFEFLLLLQL